MIFFTIHAHDHWWAIFNTFILWAHWHLSFLRKGCRERAQFVTIWHVPLVIILWLVLQKENRAYWAMRHNCFFMNRCIPKRCRHDPLGPIVWVGETAFPVSKTQVLGWRGGLQLAFGLMQRKFQSSVVNWTFLPLTFFFKVSFFICLSNLCI